MKFPIFSRTKPIAPLDIGKDDPAPNVSSSTQDSSTSQIEKEETVLRPSSRQDSQLNDEKSIVETTPMGEVGALDKLSDEPEYPSGPKL